MSSAAPSLARFVARAQRLYTLPAVALRVLELTGDQQVDAGLLKSCLEQDPALAAKVLRVVNSSLFGVSTQVADLTQALALLGLKPLQLLVLSFSLPPDLCQPGNAEALLGYWRHALTKAVAAREIAARWITYPPDEAFLAALLQDIGTLVLVKELGPPYAAFLSRALAEEADLAAVEIQTLGFDHTVLSARLLDHWRLPAGLVRAVAVPHDAAWIASLPAAGRRLPQILHLAELVAQLLARQRPRVLAHLLEAGKKYAGLATGDIDRLVESLEPTVAELAELLKFPLNTGRSYRELLADAQLRLTELNESVATELAWRRAPGFEQLWNESRQLADAVAAATALPLESSHAETLSPATPLTPAALFGGDRRGAHREAAAAPAAALIADADAHLTALLSAAISRSRSAHSSVSLLLLEVEGFSDLVLARGPLEAEQAMRFLLTACRVASGDPGAGLRLSHSRLALILPLWDRSRALAAARQLIQGVERFAREPAEGSSLKLNIGAITAALPPPNLTADTLIEAAERCLYGAKASGGNGLKSLEIC